MDNSREKSPNLKAEQLYRELENPDMLEIKKIDYLFNYERIARAVSSDLLRLIFALKENKGETAQDIAREMYAQLHQLVLNEDMAWYCTAHWLNCFYSDYLYERVAGEQHPCGKCKRQTECMIGHKTTPLESFLPLMKKTGVIIKHGFSPEEEEERQKEIKENRRKRGQI